MSSNKSIKPLSVPQLAITLIGGEQTLKKLRVGTYTASGKAVRLNFGEPHFIRVTMLRIENVWELLAHDELDRELILIRRIDDKNLKQWLFLINQHAGLWTKQTAAV